MLESMLNGFYSIHPIIGQLGKLSYSINHNAISSSTKISKTSLLFTLKFYFTYFSH